MPDITQEIDIAVPFEKVFDALTKEEHLRKWWTPDASAQADVDSEARFEFNPYGDFVVVRIEKLENEFVQWNVVDSVMMKTKEWIGTTITFKLTPHENGTKLSFAHTDWKQESECFNACTKGWDHFLRESLKPYLETGTGQPFTGK